MRQLLEALATPKPLVLLLDDLHWADAGSIELLGALLRRPPDAGVLIALAVRPRQLPERLAGALDLLGAEVATADAAALYADSGGNPLDVSSRVEVARAVERAERGREPAS